MKYFNALLFLTLMSTAFSAKAEDIVDTLIKKLAAESKGLKCQIGALDDIIFDTCGDAGGRYYRDGRLSCNFGPSYLVFDHAYVACLDIWSDTRKRSGSCHLSVIGRDRAAANAKIAELAEKAKTSGLCAEISIFSEEVLIER